MNAQEVTTKTLELFHVVAHGELQTLNEQEFIVLTFDGLINSNSDRNWFFNEIEEFVDCTPINGEGLVGVEKIILAPDEWELFFQTANLPIPPAITRATPIIPNFDSPSTTLHSQVYLPQKWDDETTETVGLGECTRCKKANQTIITYMDTDLLCGTCTKKYTRRCGNCSRSEYKKRLKKCDVCTWELCRECSPVHGCFKLPEEKKAQRREIYAKAIEKNVPFWSLKEPYKNYTKMYVGGHIENSEYIKHKRFVGVEIEAEGGDLFGLNMLLPEQVGISKDGSLNITGVEVQTPPASGDALEYLVKDICSTLRKKDYRGTIACGLHVHIDASGFKKNKEKLAQIIKTFYSIEDIIFSIIPPSRWVSHYCQRLCKDYTYNNFTSDKGLDESWYKEDDSNLLRVRKTRKYDRARYYGLNMHSLSLNGTIELRYHSGTVNAKRILQWISFTLFIMEYALQNYKEEEVKALFDMETGWRKFNAMCGIMKLSPSLKNYLEKRVSKFNPDFRIKFNKGKNIRTKERRIYNKINLKIQEAEKEIRKRVVAELKAQYKVGGIDRPETRRGREFFEAVEEKVSDKLKILFPKEYKIIPADGGFIWDKEIENIMKFINQGRSLATEQNEEGEVEV